MDSSFTPKYRIITVSGKIAVGTSTLARNLSRILGWKYVNVGAIQREFDRKQGINENRQGAASRSDAHERSMEEKTMEMLKSKSNIVYEAWLSGYVARGVEGVLKVLLVCSHDDIRVDRVVNRDGLTVDAAKAWMKQREEENVKKWQKLYGAHNFWDPKYYDLVIDTYQTGPMETMGKVLDRLGKK
ncbi:MAG: AAA family ATPase [Patescibacteria group bacterium]